MRKLIFGSLVCIALFSACKEDHHLVILTNVIPPADTSYMEAAETPQAHNVLFEEFTGAKCPHCPTGHRILDSQVAQHAQGRVNVLALHCNVTGQSQPVPGSKYDFRTNFATSIAVAYYGAFPTSTLPDGGADRAPIGTGGTTNLDYSGWPSAIGARINVDSSPVNLYVSSTFDAASSTATVLVTIKYTKTVASGQNLSIALVEDSLIDLQEDLSVTDTFYVFNNILRDMITQSNGFSGDHILSSSTQISAGTVDARRYTYKVNVGAPTNNSNLVLSPSHCRLVAFVTDNASAVVYQSAQCKLVGP